MVKLRNKKIYWALIGTFIALYLAVAFVSTLHAITFFQLANTLGLAILLGAAYEIGQASVLFSILMTENKNRLLAWGMMFLLTALQVTANVYASFKFMDMSGTEDWRFWQRAILFGVQAENDEMYKVIISWISGALLPLVALGMTALVADNIKLATGQDEEDPEKLEEIVENEVQRRMENITKDIEPSKPTAEDPDQERIKEKMGILNKAQQDLESGKSEALETETIVLNEPKSINLQDRPESLLLDIDDQEKIDFKEGNGIIPEEKEIDEKPEETIFEAPVPLENIKPVNKQNGWHFMKEFVDDEHNVFHKGKYIENDPTKTPTSKKA